MITDNQTNVLYLADTLIQYDSFFKAFVKLLQEKKIQYKILEKTKDIWAVDYMPIQITENEFVQFNYEPDYLREYPEYKTKPEQVTNLLDIKDKIHIKPSDIILDGGNVVKLDSAVIMCDKVFYENRKKYTEKELIKKLKTLLKFERIIFVPWDEDDFTGHADGMVRFIEDNKVLINKYPKNHNPEFQTSFRMALHNAGLEYIELPYFMPDDPTGISARGLYLNYLQMENIIIMPAFGLKSDDEAYKTLEKEFPKHKIFTVNCNDIAKEGGVLNCISWNIKI